MAEAVAAVASVIAIIQITDRVVGLCKFYIETVKDVASDLRLILLEVSTLKTVLENLNFLNEHNRGVSHAVSTLSGKDGAIEGCLRSIAELEKLFPSDWKSTAGRYKSKKQRVKATWAALVWPLKEKKAKKLLDEIMRYKTTITLAITTDSIQDIKDIRIKTWEMHHMIIDNQCQEVYNWLQHTDPSPLHHLAQKLYEPGTGNWMLCSSEWTNWLQAKQRCLWIHGIPGAGKTVLMSYLITQIKQYDDGLQDGKAACVYYYCYYGHDQDETGPFLRWLVNQLCRQADVVPASVYKMYKYGGEPSLEELLSALEEILQKFEIAYVIVDAIDESKPREDLLKVFRDLATDLRFAKIQLLVSSREYIDIERAMEDFAVPLSMANDFVQEDIRIHVRHKIRSNPKLTRWPQDLLDEVEEAVSIGARGMFRWAVCQLDVIQRLKGESYIVQKALKDLPKTLDETYNRILLTLSEEDQQFVHHALQFILYHNNLYGGDGNGSIPCAVLIRGVERSIAVLTSKQNDRFYDHETLRELCGCLINVTQEQPNSRDVLAGAYPQIVKLTVSFAHYTVYEYLASNRVSKTSTAYITSWKEDLKLTFTGMAFSECLQSKSSDRWDCNVAQHDTRECIEAIERYYKDYCLKAALYSLRRWSAQISRHDTLSKLATVLLDPSKAHFHSLQEVAHHAEKSSTPWDELGQFWSVGWNTKPSNNNAAHLLNLSLLAISSPECLSLARDFLQGESSKDFLGNRLTFTKRVCPSNYRYQFDGSIIEVFAQLAFGASGIFRLLLEHGTGLFDPSAILLLYIGCHQRHPNHDCHNYCLVERLLQLGADPKMSECWVTPLQIAVDCSDFEAVTILLEAGADPDPIQKSEGVVREAGTLMTRFNRLHGASPLQICRNSRRFQDRKDDSKRIEAILLQYGARSYMYDIEGIE